ncbi:MAG: TIGR00341 family protein [Candidatus Bathyarchaeota archaeon]
MKRLIITVVSEQSKDIERILKSLELAFSSSIVEIGDKKCKLFSSLIPDKLVDKAIEEISKAIDTRLKENTISIYNVEAHISTHVDRIAEKIIKESPPTNPFERLVENAEKYTKINMELLMMALFSTIIALAGLFLDNPVTIIGAMLLSPLLGPINAFAVNACIGKIKKILRIEISIITLLFSVIILSAVITFIISIFFDLPIGSQIINRSQTSLVDIGIGLILGLAGGLALVSAVADILIGVGVASALLPPAAVSGISLALANGELFSGALILMVVYLVGLQLGCTIMLRFKGVRPRKFYQRTEARKHSAYFIITFSI